MKILIVTGIFPPDRGGPASYVPRIATAFVKRGHQVEVISLSDRLDHDDSKYPFPVHRIRRSTFWPWRIAVTTFTIWRKALRHDLVYVSGLASESALAALLAGRATVQKVVGDHAWERATAHYWYSGTLDEYQISPKSARLRFLDCVRTLPLRRASRVIVPSGYLRKIVGGWGIAREKIRVILNAVEPPTTSPADTPTLPPWNGKTLLAVGRLVLWKRVDGLIQVLPELPDTRLIVVGDGCQRPKLEALAQSCGVTDRVRFLGSLPPDSVRRCFNQADAFVLNSTYEGLPHVVLEAMAAGVPVIATNAGGTGEVVEHNVTGLLIPVGDSSELKVAVERLWREPALGRQLAAEATRQLRTRFDFDAMVNATEAALRNVIDAPCAASPVTVEEG